MQCCASSSAAAASGSAAQAAAPSAIPTRTSSSRRDSVDGMLSDSFALAHFQIHQVIVQRFPLPCLVGLQLLDLSAELFDFVLLRAELLHVALVKIRVAFELAHVLADAGLLFADPGNLLFHPLPILQDLFQGLLALDDLLQGRF